MLWLLIAAQIVTTVPSAPAKNRHYLFYLHGRAIEDGGRRPETRFGRYEYDRILDALNRRDVVVVSEARKPNTSVSAYARTVVDQVKSLIAAGVPPGRITVIGASKGAVIAMLVSTYLQHPSVGFVLMGNCNDSVFESVQPKLAGRVLSIYEKSDEFGGSCERFREAGAGITAYDEIALTTGLNHGFLYQPLDGWVRPALRWAGKGM